ncbi:unnamed protein product, partial [marine sediment metagenome]
MGGEIDIEAEAKKGKINKATVEIDADDDVEMK